MKKVVKFCKEHKKGLLVTGCLIGATVVGVKIGIKVGKRNVVDLTGRNVISWKPGKEIINLDRVKEILDLNANSSAMFAIFREGVDPNAYVCIELNNTTLVSK